jgi:hypothetical protein
MARDRMIFSSNFGEFQRSDFSGKTCRVWIFTALVLLPKFSAKIFKKS